MASDAIFRTLVIKPVYTAFIAIGCMIFGSAFLIVGVNQEKCDPLPFNSTESYKYHCFSNTSLITFGAVVLVFGAVVLIPVICSWIIERHSRKEYEYISDDEQRLESSMLPLALPAVQNGDYEEIQ